MMKLSQREKFELWEKNNIDLYYKFKDIQLHHNCILESLEDLQFKLQEKTADDCNIIALKKVFSNLKETFGQISQTMNDLENQIEKKQIS